MRKKTRQLSPLGTTGEPDVTSTPGTVAVAKEPPILIQEDTVEGGVAAEERVAAFDGEYFWKGKELLPYTPTKRGLWERLCALDVPLPANVELTHLEAYAPQALKLMFLLTHDTEDYAHLRSRPEAFLGVIDEWIDETCVHADMLDAVNLALKVHNDALRNVAVAAPSPDGKGGNSGN